MASGLKKQDGKKIACVLVATKEGKKEQDHTAEGRLVITREFISVEKRISDDA